jgi:hypothetical protein
MGKLTNFSPTFPMFPGDAALITTSDTVTFNPSVLYIGVGGNLRVQTAQGTDILFSAVPAGFILPVQVIQVYATNTTASSMVRIY